MWLMFVLACTSTPTAPPPILVAAPKDPGEVHLERREWAWEGERGVAWLARLPRDARMTVLPSTEVVPLATLQPNPPMPSATLNGGFYDDGAMGLVRTKGVEHTPLSQVGGSGVIYQRAGQPLALTHRDKASEVRATEALQSIDRLVVGGRSVVTAKEDAPRSARSAVVMSHDAVWLVVHAGIEAIDDHPTHPSIPRPYGHGMPLWAFADWLIAELRAVDALNMDGGLSTNFIVRTPTASLDLTGASGTINAVMMQP